MTRNSTYNLDDHFAHNEHSPYKLYCYVTHNDDDGEVLYFRNVRKDGSWGTKQIAIWYFDGRDTRAGKEQIASWDGPYAKYDDWRKQNHAALAIA